MLQIYRRTPIPKCDLRSCFTTLLKSHFGMGAPMQNCSIFSENLFLRTPLDGCFCVKLLVKSLSPRPIFTKAKVQKFVIFVQFVTKKNLNSGFALCTTSIFQLAKLLQTFHDPVFFAFDFYVQLQHLSLRQYQHYRSLLKPVLSWLSLDDERGLCIL